MSCWKRMIALLLVCITVGLMTGPVYADIPAAYWPIQAEYTAALEKNDGAGIIRAVKKLEALYPKPTTESEYLQLAFPLQQAASAYEKQGNFPQAAAYYKKALTCVEWLDKNVKDFYDLIQGLKSLIRHCDVQPAVYTLSATPSVTYNAKHEPASGTYFGRCNSIDSGEPCSAFMLYTHFYDEDVEDFAWLLPKNTDNYLLELAWNMPNESLADLQNVVKPETKDYIVKNLQYLEALDVPVIIRFAAEVNCWPTLPGTSAEAELKKFTDAYIAAFRYVAKLADEYAPKNVAMAYAPLDISNWYVDVMDFYPGDEYVDWIAINSYINKASKTVGTAGSGTDAYYSLGLYDNQLTKIQHIVELFGDRKPLFIGECGFCYQDTEGLQTSGYAAEKLTEFYTYVNMVYPQIKAVFHYDNDMDGNLYSIQGNDAVSDAYAKAVRNNAPMQSMLNDKSAPANYRKLETFSEKADTLQLYTYASYPTNAPVTVTYTLNGKKLTSGTTAPYSCSITPGQLDRASNQLTVNITCAATVKTLQYILQVKDGVITATMKP